MILINRLQMTYGFTAFRDFDVNGRECFPGPWLPVRVEARPSQDLQKRYLKLR